MIENYSDNKLLLEVKKIRSKERHYTHLVLKHMAEIWKRRVYADLGYHTFLKYLVSELGYSEAEGYLRISAMKLMVTTPMVEKKVESGELNLTQAATAGKLFNQFEKENKRQLDNKKKVEILNLVVGKSTGDGEKIIRNELNIKRKFNKKIILSERVEKKFDRVKKLYQNVDDHELIEILLDEKLNGEKYARPKIVHTKNRASKVQRYITAKTKREVFERSKGVCEHSKCSARTCLEFEHLRPIALGDRLILKIL